MEQAPIVINTGSASGMNWWLWGTVILVGAIAVGAVVLTVWSHNTNANNMADLADNTATSLTNLNTTINNVNSANRTLKQQIDLNNTTVRDYVVNFNNHITTVEKKIDNNIEAVNVLKENYEKITALNNANVLELSKKSLEITQKAASTLQEMSEISSTSEGVVVGIAKIYDVIKNYGERLTVVETKIDSLAESTTPRLIFRASKAINPNPTNE